MTTETTTVAAAGLRLGGAGRASKFAFVQLHGKAAQQIAAVLLHNLIAAVPYTVHTVRC